jgi:hypothetical protein
MFKPTGPFAAGVVSRLLTDPSRRNLYNVSTTNCAKSFATREGFERAVKGYVVPEVGLPWPNG